LRLPQTEGFQEEGLPAADRLKAHPLCVTM
jgi:hypothetical protein